MNKDRKLAATCYDHLSGILGEGLFRHFIVSGWIKKSDEGREYHITSEGWIMLERLGIKEETLKKSKRKILSPCIERHNGKVYEHAGAHLGTLLCERLFEMGWIEKTVEKDCIVTQAGIAGFKAMGLEIENC